MRRVRARCSCILTRLLLFLAKITNFRPSASCGTVILLGTGPQEAVVETYPIENPRQRALFFGRIYGFTPNGTNLSLV